MDKQDKHIAVLDGVRAYAMLLIMGFHLWQQSWLQNIFPSDLLQPLGISYFSLNWISRTGYMFVDVLLLLSAFCLFLPYARQMTDPLSPVPDTPGVFFCKRAARILPSYYLCLLVYLTFWIRPEDYYTIGSYWKDIFTHLTFTHTFFPDTYFSTKFPTALWTLCTEMQFYLLFPLLARIFRRFPLQTWLALNIIAELYLSLFARTAEGGANSFLINQFPAFLGVFANGMLAAFFSCRLRAFTARLPQNRVHLLGTLLSFFFGLALLCMLKDNLNQASVVQRWQVDYRFLFSAVACMFILSLEHAHRDLQWFFSNKAVRFLASISYNLYIWHFLPLLKLKEWRIPFYPDAPEGISAWPQSANGESWHLTWQLQYTALFWISVIVLAALVTYLVEKPLAGWILGRKNRKAHSAENLQ